MKKIKSAFLLAILISSFTINAQTINQTEITKFEKIKNFCKKYKTYIISGTSIATAALSSFFIYSNFFKEKYDILNIINGTTGDIFTGKLFYKKGSSFGILYIKNKKTGENIITTFNDLPFKSAKLQKFLNKHRATQEENNFHFYRDRILPKVNALNESDEEYNFYITFPKFDSNAALINSSDKNILNILNTGESFLTRQNKQS